MSYFLVNLLTGPRNYVTGFTVVPSCQRPT